MGWVSVSFLDYEAQLKAWSMPVAVVRITVTSAIRDSIGLLR